MPNLVPITTVQAVTDMLYVAILTDPIRNRKATTQDSNGYVAQGAITRAYAVGGMLYGLPDKPETPEVPEADRPASRLTAYVVPHDAESYAEATTRAKLAQFIRISGLRGVAVLERTVTARGSATRNVPNHLSGMPPAERAPLVLACEDDTVSEPEVRQLRRYRNAMKGEKFAASMERETRERDRAYWRAALPFWPLDKAGRFESGKRRINPETGRETLRFLDGSYLDDRIEQHKAMNRDEAERIESKRTRELSRIEELRELADMQAEDDIAFRKSRKAMQHAERMRKLAIAAIG